MSAKILNFVYKPKSTGSGNVVYLSRVSAADRETVDEFIEGVNAFVASRSPSGRKAVLVSRERFPTKASGQ